jgi:hypothetical protein
MSDQQQQRAPKRKLSLPLLITVVRSWLQLIRAEHDPHAFKQTVEKLAQENGVPPSDMPVVHHALLAVRDAAKGKQPAFIDLYLVGGMGALDLIVLQVLLSAHTSGLLLSSALFCLVLSLPCTAMSLFFSFLKEKYSISTYGKIHGTFSFVALISGTFALDGAIWHVSPVDGVVFLCIAGVMYLWALFYLILLQAALRFQDLQKPPDKEEPEQK